MSTRGKLVLVATVTGLGVLLALANWRSREPSYEGKALSYWISSFSVINETVPAWVSVPQSGKAGDAVRRIGTNGIPLLLEWVSYDAPGRRGRLLRLPLGLQRSSLLERLYVNRSKERRAGEAAMALICLGPNAAPAFPQLGRLLTEGSLFGAGSSALAILREIGEPAVPTLAAAMTNKTSDMRLIIAMNLGIMGPKAHAAVPALESLLQDPQPGLRNTCIQAIESTTGKPSTNIPPSQVGP